MKEYAFDCKLWAAIRVRADSEEDARRQLNVHLDCASANFGTWDNGDPILAEVSIEDDDGFSSELYEVDGEPI